MKTAAPLALLALLLCAAPVSADENPSFRFPTDSTSPETTSERAFVATMQADLAKRFPRAQDAEKAGYVRYTSEDETGAISYTNRAFQSSDVHHPSQLWYDKNGRLLGADYSQIKTGDAPPKLWGIGSGRWWEFDRHIHYVYKDGAKTVYDSYIADDDWMNAGGSLTDPKADILVKMGKVKTADSVVTVFSFPTVWDLVVWAVPNPKGAFAVKNPNVIP